MTPTEEADEIWEFINNETEAFTNQRATKATRTNNTIEIWTHWTHSQIWHTFQMVRNMNHLSRTTFTINPQNGTQQVYAKYEPKNTQHSTPSNPTPNQLKETIQNNHPLTEITARTTEFKCGDINKLLSELLIHKYNFPPTKVQGRIENPQTNNGWPHAFLHIPSHLIQNQTEDHILDGTAKQFCDSATSFPQTLGPEEEIPEILLIPQSHEWVGTYYRSNETDLS